MNMDCTILYCTTVIQKQDTLWKKEATQAIKFGLSKTKKKKFISSWKAFIDFKQSIAQKENIIQDTVENDWPMFFLQIHRWRWEIPLENDHIASF